MVDGRPRCTRTGLLTIAAAALLLAAACTARPPRNIDDGCSIFEEKRGWLRAARESDQRWGVPVHVLLAIIHQESRFRADARPPRRRILRIFPGPRPSDASGYAQALTSTWREYERESGNGCSDPGDFEDAIQFVGWYTARSARVNRIAPDDTFNLYLAYHEGDGGFRRGTYRRKPWLLRTARAVAERAQRYRSQLLGCEDRLRPRWWE